MDALSPTRSPDSENLLSISSDEMSHIYTPLEHGQLRLLKILPGHAGSEIYCRIQPFDLVTAPTYTAVSYAWGNGPPQHSIRLNGVRYWIRKNLWRFLSQRRITAPHLSSLVWIDALCINQVNSPERTSQVEMMPQIYSIAEHVIIWLGPAYSGSDAAMKSLARYSPFAPAPKKFVSLWSQSTASDIRGLCARPYWKRLWIFQEMLLAKRAEVMCGDQSVPLECLRTFLLTVITYMSKTRLKENETYSSVLGSAALSVVQQTATQPSERTLWDLVHATQHLRCTDPRDKVYALLGVASMGSETIRPDYSTSLPTLVNNVLRNHHSTKPPSDLHEVEQQCKRLAQMFAIDADSIFDLTGQQGYIEAPPESVRIAWPLRWKQSEISLWWAAFYGHSQIVALIHSQGVIETKHVYLAISSATESLLNLLLHAGPPDLDWLKILDWSVYHNRVGYVKSILDSDTTGICWALRKWDLRPHISGAISLGHINITKVFMERNLVDFDYTETDGAISLHTAVNSAHEGMTSLFLSDQVTSRLRENMNPILTSWRHGETMKILMGINAYVNAGNAQGWTPLGLAIQANRKHAVQALIDSGELDINSRSKSGLRPLESAISLRRVEIVRLLLKAPGVDLHTTSDDGGTLLHFAVEHDAAVVETLLKHSDIPVDARNKSGRTALYQATSAGNVAVVRALLELGDADPNLSVEDDVGPIHIAAENGWKHIVTLLINTKRLDVNARDRYGNTAFDLAVRNDLIDVVRELLSAPGIDVLAGYAPGFDPAQKARMYQRYQMSELIANHLQAQTRQSRRVAENQLEV